MKVLWSCIVLLSYCSMGTPLCNFIVKIIQAHFLFKDENISDFKYRYVKISSIRHVRAFVILWWNWVLVILSMKSSLQWPHYWKMGCHVGRWHVLWSTNITSNRFRNGLSNYFQLIISFFIGWRIIICLMTIA
jgi:hypothetical protein